MSKNPIDEAMVRYRAIAVLLLSLLVVSGILGIFALPNPANAAASADTGANWENINYNLNGTNDSPQTAIGPSNVANLVMNWTVPMPSTDPTWAQVNGPNCYPNCATWAVEPGADSPPLIVEGIAYFVTNQGVLYAVNAENGVQVWSKAITANFQTALKTVPLIESQVGNGNLTPCGSTTCGYNDTFWCSSTVNPAINCASPVEHKHGINYLTINYNGTPEGIISVTGFDCEVWGFNAITGDVAYHIINICANVPGNGGGAYPATYTSDPPEYYGGMLVYVMGGYTDMGGRTFLVAYNATSVLAAGAAGFNGDCAAGSGTYSPGGTLYATCAPATAGQGPMWQLFLQPPSTGDANWDNEACQQGWVFDYSAFEASGTTGIPCTSIPDSVKTEGGGDWGVPKAAASGVSTSWGQYAIDNKTGVMYFGTGEAGPFEYCYGPTCPANANERPGLNLYSSSVMAVDLHTGKILWWYQMLPHGLNDQDASWNTIIGTTNGTGAIFKGDKEGILFSLNAQTGKANWVYISPSVKYEPGSLPYDPTNATQMLTPWPDYPNATWIQSPGLGGSLESDLAYDGQNIYGAWFNSAPIVYKMDNSTQYADTVRTLNWPDNTTVSAINANTGKVVWSRFFNNFVFRGGMTVTNGMLIIPTGNGTIYFLNTKDGSTISKLYDGSPMFSDPTIGQAANGQWVMLQILGGGRWLSVGDVGASQTQPGALMAFTVGTGTGVGTTSVSTTAIAVASNLPLNYISYAAVTFAIVVTVANVVIRGRGRKPGG